MNYRLSFVVLVVLMSLVFVPEVAAREVGKLNCEAPLRPSDDQNDALWQAFLLEIEAFRSCTQHHMESHQDAVAAHQEGAKQAVAAWNDFVHSSLNAPEDFPWPPEDR